MRRHWPAGAILLLFLVVGCLYAVYTPIWQVPDEPAHYNYVRSLAEGRGFPVMQMGDYDQAYLSLLTSERFPADLSIDSLRYEGHQPPLYYLLATPVFWLFNGSVIALRVFSVLLGALGIGGLMLLLRELLPSRPGIAWLGAGIVAFIPQYLAMMAGVNNDALTLALLWLWLWLALRFLRGGTSPWLMGAALGALLVTKTTGYGALLLAPLAIWLRAKREGQPFLWMVRQAVSVFLPAFAIGAFWWGRNLAVYGWPDVMGLMRHDAVVLGQPRTVDWIARDGLLTFLLHAGRTTFRSFWGQFGWMGVVLDARIYHGLTLFSALIVWGSSVRLVEALRRGMEPRQRDALILLSVSALITVTLFLIYNLTFVQHQGRYLFPGLPAFALAAALGLERLLERRFAVVTAFGLLGVLLVVAGSGLLSGSLSRWSLLLTAAAMVGVPLASFIPRQRQGLLGVALLAAAVSLDLVCLFGFIVPMLS